MHSFICWYVTLFRMPLKLFSEHFLFIYVTLISIGCSSKLEGFYQTVFLFLIGACFNCLFAYQNSLIRLAFTLPTHFSFAAEASTGLATITVCAGNFGS